MCEHQHRPQRHQLRNSKLFFQNAQTQQTRVSYAENCSYRRCVSGATYTSAPLCTGWRSQCRRCGCSTTIVPPAGWRRALSGRGSCVSAIAIDSERLLLPDLACSATYTASNEPLIFTKNLACKWLHKVGKSCLVAALYVDRPSSTQKSHFVCWLSHARGYFELGPTHQSLSGLARTLGHSWKNGCHRKTSDRLFFFWKCEQKVNKSVLERSSNHERGNSFFSFHTCVSDQNSHRSTKTQHCWVGSIPIHFVCLTRVGKIMCAEQDANRDLLY